MAPRIGQGNRYDGIRAGKVQLPRANQAMAAVRAAGAGLGRLFAGARGPVIPRNFGPRFRGRR